MTQTINGTATARTVPGTPAPGLNMQPADGHAPVAESPVALNSFLYRRAHLKALLGYGDTSLDGIIRSEGFPAPRDLTGTGRGDLVWIADEVHDWVRSRPARALSPAKARPHVTSSKLAARPAKSPTITRRPATRQAVGRAS